jgi:hypothetical protein
VTPGYRYTLSREFGDPLLEQMGWPHPPTRRVLWVMLNPSTATETKPDQTISKCIGFTKLWGWHAFHVVNLFAMRATEPKDLFKAMRSGVDVVGPGNDGHIVAAANWSGEQLVVCAWGGVPNMPGVRNRIAWVKELLRPHRLHALGFTKGYDLKTVNPSGPRPREGEPRHPLMLAYETPLEVYCR